MRYLIPFVVILVLLDFPLFSQPINDNCESAILLQNVKDWCSTNGQFNNIGATDGAGIQPNCWDATDNDVWFRFTAIANSVDIIISGNGNNGTLKKPLVSLYVDNGCSGQIQGNGHCKKDNFNKGIIELLAGGLIIGESYLIKVDGENGNTGTFKLCIKNFFPPIEPGQDCKTASLLCDKSPFVVQSVTGIGNNKTETNETCIDEERHSTWFKWIAKNDGSLTFTLTPLQKIDDLDFVVYELPGGINDCDNRVIIRCGAAFGGNNVRCGPKTGLSLNAKDITELGGCDSSKDGFLRYLNMKKGRTYCLIVNNWSDSDIGFGIEFGGTGEFEGPEPDFTFDPPLGLRCEDSIKVSDLTSYNIGTIDNYYWTFGRDAFPQTKKGKGPTSIWYDSYGWKSISLTVESDKGCVSTIVKDVWMEPCCEDLPEEERLKIVVDSVKNPNCPEDKNGFVTVSGLKGDPYYQFSIQDTNFNYKATFTGLSEGEYKLYIVDKKGCRDSLIIQVEDPEPLVVDAGPDQNIELGDITSMNGKYYPSQYDVNQIWTPPYNLFDSSDLKTDVFPYETTTYTLTVTKSEEGCIASDNMTIYVKDTRAIRIPNVFTPNGDGMNDYFTAFNVHASLSIDKIFIYDRWGELIYSATDIPIGDRFSGWDGRYKGQKVNPGVYVYLIMVKFLDDKILPYSGDITVLR